MPTEDWTHLDTLTFVTAWLGYLCVTVAMLARYARSQRTVRWAAPTMGGVACLHVFLIWVVRYEMDPGNAAEGGLVPTILLYSLFLLTVGHAIGHAWSTLAGRLVYPAWFLVTLLGVPSSFTMSYLSWLRIPMTLTFAGGLVGLAVIFRRRRAGVPSASG